MKGKSLALYLHTNLDQQLAMEMNSKSKLLTTVILHREQEVRLQAGPHALVLLRMVNSRYASPSGKLSAPHSAIKSKIV